VLCVLLEKCAKKRANFQRVYRTSTVSLMFFMECSPVIYFCTEACLLITLSESSCTKKLAKYAAIQPRPLLVLLGWQSGSCLGSNGGASSNATTLRFQEHAFPRKDEGEDSTKRRKMGCSYFLLHQPELGTDAESYFSNFPR